MATYWVAKAADGGSDSNNGTSISTPWLTLNKSVYYLHAGDTLYIRAGTYYEQVSWGYLASNDGADGSPVTITNYNSEAVIIDGP